MIDAEYCHLRTEAVVRVPSDIDPAEYCPFLCAGVTVFNGIRQLKITPGETIAIQGLGGLGHLAIQYAARMGYRAVALSSSGSKEKFAKELGATDYVDGSKEDQAEALQKIGGAALIVVTAPNPSTIGQLINGLAPQGKLLILARELIIPSIEVVLANTNSSRWRGQHKYNSHDHERSFCPRVAFRTRARQRRGYQVCTTSQR